MEELEQPVRRLTFAGAIFWTVCTTFFFILLASITTGIRAGAQTDLVTLTATEVLGYSLVLALMLRIYQAEQSLTDAFAFRAFSPPNAIFVGIPAVICAVALGAGFFPVDLRLTDLLTARFPTSPESTEFLEKVLDTSTIGRKLIFSGSTAIVLPVVNEVFFRGMLFGRLKETYGSLPAVLATSMIYTLSQLDPRKFPSALLFALLLGTLRAVTGGIVVPIAAHIGSTLPAIFLIWRNLEHLPPGVHWLPMGIALTATALALIVALARGRGGIIIEKGEP